MIEHIFPFMQSAEHEHTRYNLRFLNQIYPMIQSGHLYRPLYYYEYSANMDRPSDDFMNLYSFWILTDDCCLAINTSLECGVVIRQTEFIRLSIQLYEKLKTETQDLLAWYDDPFTWMLHVQNIQQAGYVTHNFYMEYRPCLLTQVDEELFRRHAMLPEQEIERLMLMLEGRKQQYLQERFVNYFTLSGLKAFMEDGYILGAPASFYTPLDLQERIAIVETFLLYMKKHAKSFYILNEEFLPLSPQAALYSSASVNNELAFYLPSNSGAYCAISESGIARELNDFCEFIQNSEFVMSPEEGIAAIRQLLDQYQKK